MLNLNKIKTLMNRVLTYILLSGLVAVGLYAGFAAFAKDKNPEKKYSFVKRQGVDSLQFKQYHAQQQMQSIPDPQPIKWEAITSAIVALTVAGAGIGFKGFKKEVYSRFKSIEDQLKSVADQKNRDTVDYRLTKIEQDAAGFVDDERVKALIEGIGSRTRSFCRDVMAMDFTDECLEKAFMKINARIQDGKHQVKDLGFSDYFMNEINKIRCDQLKQLKLDLSRLVQDKLHNSKYERFSEIICRFQRNFMRSVIRLANDTKQA